MEHHPGTDRTDDTGLGLVEVVVSVLVLTVALLALVPVQTRALGTVVLSEERQQATAYANEAIERVRAQALTAAGASAVAAGRRPTADDTGNVASTSCTTNCQFQPALGAGSPTEPLRTTATPATSLATVRCSETSPCTATGTVTGLTFTTRLYVTETGTSGLYWVTAVTSWTSANSSAGLRKVAVRTQIAAP